MNKEQLNNLPYLLTQKQAQQHLGVTPYAFYTMGHEKTGIVVKIGGRYFLNRLKFLELVDGSANNKME